jgi:hypothetical protein
MTTSAPTLAEQASPEVKKALKLVGRRERLNALAREGLLRAAAIHQPEASEAMEAAALEFAEQEEDVQRELDALKGDAENRAYMLFNSEH